MKEHKYRHNISIIIFLLIGMTILLVKIINNSSFDVNQIILASSSVLLFNAVFYSFIVSKEGKYLTTKVRTYLTDASFESSRNIKELFNLKKSKVVRDNPKNLENIDRVTNKYLDDKEIISFVREHINLINKYLYVGSLSFLISIVIAFFPHQSIIFISFLFFIIGFIASISLLNRWYTIHKIISCIEPDLSDTEVYHRLIEYEKNKK